MRRLYPCRGDALQGVDIRAEEERRAVEVPWPHFEDTDCGFPLREILKQAIELPRNERKVATTVFVPCSDAFPVEFCPFLVEITGGGLLVDVNESRADSE